MRVALISTFPPAECGIGNYSQQLVSSLAACGRGLEVTVLAERVPDVESTHRVQRCWHRRSNWVDKIANAVGEITPDVVHVQHEESMFGQGRRFLELLARIQRLGVRTVVTLHTVHDGWRGRSFHRNLGGPCDRVIAHQQHGMASVLEHHGMRRSQIEVIAHGTPRLAVIDRVEARERLDLPVDAPIALFFGFIHYGKGLHFALDGFERAAAHMPELRFVIAGRIRRAHVLDTLYMHALLRRLRRGIASGRVIFRPGFVPAELKPAYYNAADVVVLPHVQAYGSASGVLHEAVAARRPVLCTHGKKFAEAAEAFAVAMPEAFPAAKDVAGWQRGFEAMFGSAETRKRATELVSVLGEQTSWSRSAERHMAIYAELVATSGAASQRCERVA